MNLQKEVLASMKSTDTEGRFEQYFTRTPGFLLALLFRKLHIHPISVTLASIVIGAYSGYFYFPENLRTNIIGMILLLCANWLDCADGQLARMTNQKTLIGRILDGFAGDVWFFSIYLFLCLRLSTTWGIWIWVLAAWAGLRCHTLQCAIADYYRNIHLWFLMGEKSSELTNSLQEQEKMKRLKWWSNDWFHKLYLFFYILYTKRQERHTPEFQALYSCILTERHGVIPHEIKERFRKDSLPLMPFTNILTFDTRVGVLFLCIIIHEPWLYFVFESTILEIIRIRTQKRHEQICKKYHQELVCV